jgi:hypothetical protein
MWNNQEDDQETQTEEKVRGQEIRAEIEISFFS